MEDAAFTPAQTARLLRSVIVGCHRDRVLVPDLDVSGPDVPGVPTADIHRRCVEIEHRLNFTFVEILPSHPLPSETLAAS